MYSPNLKSHVEFLSVDFIKCYLKNVLVSETIKLHLELSTSLVFVAYVVLNSGQFSPLTKLCMRQVKDLQFQDTSTTH